MAEPKTPKATTQTAQVVPPVVVQQPAMAAQAPVVVHQRTNVLATIGIAVGSVIVAGALFGGGVALGANLHASGGFSQAQQGQYGQQNGQTPQGQYGQQQGGQQGQFGQQGGQTQQNGQGSRWPTFPNGNGGPGPVNPNQSTQSN